MEVQEDKGIKNPLESKIMRKPLLSDDDDEKEEPLPAKKIKLVAYDSD